jgi:hypothetical protein
MDGAAICNVVGLIMNLAGVILLFFYVMPRYSSTSCPGAFAPGATKSC